ncbi:hypothetical protein PUN28_005003 [Cardiocondyla obscurior]|uniref:Uncharacterized protein n=1 Tax=Cardiocondyla obscurior TaxID=286306 RepID=A0AAW2GJJ9_9HYME
MFSDKYERSCDYAQRKLEVETERCNVWKVRATSLLNSQFTLTMIIIMHAQPFCYLYKLEYLIELLDIKIKKKKRNKYI